MCVAQCYFTDIELLFFLSSLSFVISIFYVYSCLYMYIWKNIISEMICYLLLQMNDIPVYYTYISY